MVWDGKDEMNSLDRAIIGKSARLTLVLDADKADLIFMADMLRGLATQLHFNARRSEISTRDALWTVKGQIEMTNRAIRKHFAEKGIYVREGGSTLKEMQERKGITDRTVTPAEIKRYNTKYDVNGQT
jgi:hypothetical protein